MPKCILIVEDHQGVRRLIRSHLESKPGFAVCGEAVDGVEAIEKAGLLKPDLIVMDLHMPRMNGLDAAARLHEMDPSVPIVMFTLHSDILKANPRPFDGISAVVAKTEGIEVLFRQIQQLTHDKGTTNARVD